ncbi:hypothetical protein GCM10018954_099110 [Kutzneria kofuensis]
MRLHIGHITGLDARRTKGSADDVLLRVGPDVSEARFAAVVAHRRTTNDRKHVVAVAHRVREPLEHNGAGAVGGNGARGPHVERPAHAVRRRDAAGTAQ